jgi:hypothetical protein
MLSQNFNKPTYIYKRFRVKRADGKSTTVSVDPALVVRACQTMGSLSSVGRVVREAALSYDSNAVGKNRSAHVSTKLNEVISKGRTPATVAAQADTASAA